MTVLLGLSMISHIIMRKSMGDLLGYYVIHMSNICKVKPALNAKNNCVKKYGKWVCDELMNSPKNASYYKTELLLELARKKTQGLSILKCRLFKSLVGKMLLGLLYKPIKDLK